MHEIETQATDPKSPWALNHVRQYLASEGTAVDHPSADRLILLYTRGHRSGLIRRTPVVHFPDGETMLVVASKAGAPDHPLWYRNLVADPVVWVRFKKDFFEARAHALGPDERPAVWEMITARTPAFADYQAKTEREIPVVRLRAVGRPRSGR